MSTEYFDSLYEIAENSSKKPYLGSPDTVETILRGLLKFVVDLRGCHLVGEESDFIAEILGECKRIQGVFYGEDDSYSKSVWFCERWLGNALVNGSQMGGETSDAIVRLMFRMVGDFSRYYIKYEDDQISDEELNVELDKTIEFYILAILGMKRQK
jgi:hypothetical protein